MVLKAAEGFNGWVLRHGVYMRVLKRAFYRVFKMEFCMTNDDETSGRGVAVRVANRVAAILRSVSFRLRRHTSKRRGRHQLDLPSGSA